MFLAFWECFPSLLGEEFAGFEKTGLGSPNSAEDVGFCVNILQQVF